MISNQEILQVLETYLGRYPDEAEELAEATQLLSGEADCAWRRTWPMHVTVGALLTRGEEIMLVNHKAYGIVLQPGGHLEDTDLTLSGAALREAAEESGIDPGTVSIVSEIPAYVEYAEVPARPDKNEPVHRHLDFGFSLVTADGEIGPIQESEVNGVAWFPLEQAERVVGHRIGRAVIVPAPQRAGPR